VPFDQTLWYLSIGGQLINDTFSLFVDFELNPLALDEIQYPSSFLASLPSFSDNVSEALAISAATTDFIVSQLAFDAAADLNAVHLFPAGTLFNAREGGVQYASAAAAVLTASEPSSLAVVAVALLCLLSYADRTSSVRLHRRLV
jgi:hypothetical protein